MLTSTTVRWVMAMCTAVAVVLMVPVSGSAAGRTPDPSPEPTTTSPSADPADRSTPGGKPRTQGQCWVYVEVLPGVFEYVNICETDGDDDGGEWEGPPCDLTKEPWNEFCRGELSCRADIPSPYPEEEWPPGRPSDRHIFTFVECLAPGADEPEGGNEWLIPYHNSLPDLGWAAYNRLQTPAFTVSFKPDELTYVGAETTFTLHGIGDGKIVGGKAGPLQAFGTLKEIAIRPGDGSGSFKCSPDFDTEKCAHVYEKMSYDEDPKDLDGRPSYSVQARLIYDVTFTRNGKPFSVPGVPEILRSPWNGVLVPVGEIQVLVE